MMHAYLGSIIRWTDSAGSHFCRQKSLQKQETVDSLSGDSLGRKQKCKTSLYPVTMANHESLQSHNDILLYVAFLPGNIWFPAPKT